MLPSLNLNHVIEQVAKDKGIKRDILIDTLESAILTAAKKVFGPARELEAQFNDETGVVELYQIMVVVENEVVNLFREITLETAREAASNPRDFATQLALEGEEADAPETEEAQLSVDLKDDGRF